MEIKQKAFNMAKRNELIALIRKLGALVREEKEFLESYAQEQADEWSHDYDKAIKCFKMLIWKIDNQQGNYGEV